MNVGSILRRWQKPREAAAGQSVAVEVLLHGEGGAQQPHSTEPGPCDRLGGGVGQVQHGDLNGTLPLVCDLVHRVGTVRQELNAAGLPAPGGHGHLEFFEYIHPDAIETEPTLPNEIGMHRPAFSVDNIDDALAIAAKHGYYPLGGVATYEDIYKLTYLRGPSGILAMFAQELKQPES